MSKIINGVASEYDMPMKYENKTTTIFIDTQDMKERYTEELYKEYLENQNKLLQNNWNELKKWLEEFQEDICYDVGGEYFCKDENMEVKVQVILDKMQELEQGKDE